MAPQQLALPDAETQATLTRALQGCLTAMQAARWLLDHDGEPKIIRKTLYDPAMAAARAVLQRVGYQDRGE